MSAGSPTQVTQGGTVIRTCTSFSGAKGTPGASHPPWFAARYFASRNPLADHASGLPAAVRILAACRAEDYPAQLLSYKPWRYTTSSESAPYNAVAESMAL